MSSESTRERPIMVHRAIFGSIERFFGILIENCSGDFPLWLAPVQLKLLPVTDSVFEYCKDIAKQAQQMGIRVEVDRGSERLAKQVRNAEQQRVPILAVIGAAEMEANTLAVRSRKLGDLGSFSISDLFTEINSCVSNAEEMSLVGIKVEKAPVETDETE